MKITANSEISFTPQYLTVDGQPWFPIMGEMHYSRYPQCYWEDELNKMKAGGIEIVSLYTIWIHHEEVEGEFDFSGQRDLHKFLETIQKTGLYCILRIGPWAHGEARNGGFPDWLLEKAKQEGFECRSDDEAYLKYAKRLYEKIYQQAKGFFLKEGGPIIGVQIENEYGHCGGFGGEKGEQHMRTLQHMAREIGFDVPLYTATGWGGAVTGGMIPVMGGYCEAPWDQRTTEIEPSGNYIFTRERNDHNIGSDHGLGHGITFDMDKFPYLTAELGGGLQVTKHRRPVATGRDTGAMSMTKLGSGVTLLGYYMYHGGTNPKGKLTSLQESKATGYPNDLPVLSYDFNAPLKEYGQITDSYREIRLLAMFAHDFGADICRMPLIEQPGNPLQPENLTDLRSSVRADGEGHGYLFINNYQRHYPMKEHPQTQLVAYGKKGEILATFPEKRDIKDGDFFFLPFHMQVGDGLLATADATPLCKIGAGDMENTYVFYTNGTEPHYQLEKAPKDVTFITLSKEEALRSYKYEKNGKSYLIVTGEDTDVITTSDGTAQLILQVPQGQQSRPAFRIYPEPGEDFSITSFVGKKHANAKAAIEGITYLTGDDFAVYEMEEVFENHTKVSASLLQAENDEERTYYIDVDNISDAAEEVFLHINYEGDDAEMFLNEEKHNMIADSFYTGQLWEVGLKRFIEKNGERVQNSLHTLVQIAPLYEDAHLYLEKWPAMEEGKACRLNEVTALSQYRINIR